MTEREYNKFEIVGFVNSYWSLLDVRNHYRDGCKSMRPEFDKGMRWSDISVIRERVREWEGNIPPELGNMWIERPYQIRDEIFELLADLESGKVEG